MKKLSKILTWIALIIGVISLIFMCMMWMEGDEAIKASEDLQSSTIVPLFVITWILFAITVIAIVFFVVRTWVKYPKTLMGSLVYIVGFVAVIAIAYALADNTPTLLSNGKSSTETDSLIADFGIWATYILGTITIISVVFGGFLKSLKK
ncbi:MAG: hypothetical protein PHD21_01760 [Flavobacteriales bacterium]|nr:hypothetical protein [Flavobacteriales bacterium]